MGKLIGLQGLVGQVVGLEQVGLGPDQLRVGVERDAGSVRFGQGLLRGGPPVIEQSLGG